MGFSHAWGRKKVLDPEKFQKIVSETQLVIKKYKPQFLFFGGIKIKGPVGWGRPILNEREIRFNGSPPFETFWLSQDYSMARPNHQTSPDGMYWEYIKTNELPYDLVVKTVLISLKNHFPDSTLQTEQEISDWNKAYQTYCELFGKTVALPSLFK